MRLLKSAVMVAALALTPCLTLAADQKAPASQPKCPFLKAQQAGNQGQSGCPAKAAEGDKSCCKKADGCTKDAAKDSKCGACPNKDKAACSQPADGGCCKKDAQATAEKPAAGACCKKDAQTTAAK